MRDDRLVYINHIYPDGRKRVALILDFQEEETLIIYLEMNSICEFYTVIENHTWWILGFQEFRQILRCIF